MKLLSVMRHLCQTDTVRATIDFVMRHVIISLSLLLCACAHTTYEQTRRAETLIEAGTSLQLPHPWALNEALRETAQKAVGRHGSPWERLVRLNRYLRDSQGLHFIYNPDATRTAQDALATRNGDCLSYANLFVALARALDVPVHFVRVREAQFFDERGHQFVVVSHVAVFYADTTANVVVEYSGQAPSWKVSDYSLLSDDEAVALHYSNLAMEELAHSEETTRARLIMELLMQHAPTVPEVHNNYAAVLMRENRHREAMAVLEEGIRRFPTFAPLLLNASQVAHVLGDDARSEQYAAEVRSSTKDPFLPFIRGTRQLELGHYAAAEQLLARAHQLKPDSITFGAYLTKAQWMNGKRDEAQETLQTLERQSPDHPLVRLLSGGPMKK